MISQIFLVTLNKHTNIMRICIIVSAILICYYINPELAPSTSVRILVYATAAFGLVGDIKDLVE